MPPAPCPLPGSRLFREIEGKKTVFRAPGNAVRHLLPLTPKVRLLVCLEHSPCLSHHCEATALRNHCRGASQAPTHWREGKGCVLLPWAPPPLTQQLGKGLKAK